MVYQCVQMHKVYSCHKSRDYNRLAIASTQDIAWDTQIKNGVREACMSPGL